LMTRHRRQPPTFVLERLSLGVTTPGRCGRFDAYEFLSGFSGYLQVDGYAGYEKIPHVTLVGCWAHARRGFVEALAVLPKEERKNGTSATAKGLAYCNRLFEIERELKELSPEERKAERLARSVPVLNEFH